MEVVVDGIIYQPQSHGGISRLYSEILPRMCDMDDSLQIALLTSGQCKQPLPTHARIQHRPLFPVDDILHPDRLWWPVVPRKRAFVQRLAVGRARGRIWHSTYYTRLDPWNGPVVVTAVDMIHERFADLYYNGPRNDQSRERKRHCVQEADAVICISESTRQDVQRFYRIDSGSLYVVPLACSDIFRRLEQRDDSLERPTKQPFLLYVGRRPRYKNFDRLIQAYSVWPYRKEVALVVVGRPWSADEERRLAELGIQQCVHLLTDVDDEKLCQLYNQAAAFVSPSLYEGFGIPLLEAMACGCPVVAWRIPSTIEVAGECPTYFELAEVESLLAAFDVALSEGRNSERVWAGLRQVKRYSWDKTAAQTLEVYRAITG